MSPVVPGWSASGSLHPRLVVRSSSPAETVLDTLASNLGSVRFRITDRTTDGFWATHVNWLALFVNDVERTVLHVTAAPLDVTVDVVSGAENRKGERHASAGLSAAVTELGRLGSHPEVDGWSPPPDD